MKRVQKNNLVLALLMVLLLLAASCTAKPTTSGSSASSSASTTAKPTIRVALMDFKGNVSAKMEKATLIQKWAEVGGVNIEVIPYDASDIATKRQTWIAAKALPDLMNNYSGNSYATVMEMGPKGAFYAVDKLLAKMPNLQERIKARPEFNDFMTASDGHIYGFPKMNDFNYYQWGWSIRQDLLEGTAMPADKITTTDDLFTALKIIKDKTGNAPWVARNEGSGPNRFLPMTVKMFGTGLRTYYNYTEKKFKYGPFDENFKKMIVFLNKCYSEGLIYKDIFTMSDDNFDSYLSSDKGYFFGDNMAKGQFFASLDEKYKWTKEVQKEKGPIFKVILPPQVDGKRYYGTISSGYIDYESLWTVAADTKAAENIAKIMDYAYSVEGNEFQLWGVDGETSFIDKTYNRKDYANVDGIHRYIQAKLWPDAKRGDPAEYAAREEWFATNVNYNDFYMSNFNMVVWTEEAFEYEFDNYYSDPNAAGGTGGINSLMTGRTMYNEAGVVPPQEPAVTFTKDEMSQRKVIETPVDTYHDENIIKFITGARPLSQWDAFLTELKNMKADELVAIYNTANSK